jgi:cytochrome c peroxidase
MRFAAESNHGANAGLKVARDWIEPIKGMSLLGFSLRINILTSTSFLAQFPWITYSDLWTLGGVAAIQEMQGPVIPWRPGRRDRDANFCTPDGRLPDASKEHSHLRHIFGRMGFNDQEIVALSGAHALGRCHKDRSGFEGPWTFSPTILTNDYFRLLLDEKWAWNPKAGLAQYEDVKTKSLMMLPTDLALIKDRDFVKWVKVYAKDNDKFFADFSAVVTRLFELGVPFVVSENDRMTFKPRSH